jgi:hypothetical protein
MFGSIHSVDRANNEFQARIDQLAMTGRPVDRQTVNELAEQVRIRLGLCAHEPEVLIRFVQQLIDLSQQQQRDPMSNLRPDPIPIRHDPNGETMTANAIFPPLFSADNGADAPLSTPNGGALEHAMLNMEQYAEMNEQLAAEIPELLQELELSETRLISTDSSSLHDVPATVPDMLPPQQQHRQPFASCTNAPTLDYREVQGGDDDNPKTSTQFDMPVFRATTEMPPRPSLALVREQPTTSSSSSRSSVGSPNHSDDDSFIGDGSVPSPASYHRGLRDGDDEAHQEHFPLDTTLLRRVTTLADVVEGRRITYLNCDIERDNVVTHEISLEAELVTLSGLFPSEFRWEALKTCFQAHDILWLSSTVFVSTRYLREEGRNVSFHDCSIEFRSWEDERELQLYAYSLPVFETGARDEQPSVLPFLFLQHVTAMLPVCYFGSIHLTYLEYSEEPRGCPIDSILEFLSNVPSGGTQQEAEPNHYTRYILEGEGTITVEALEVILAHRFHPSVKLAFGEYSFADNSVPFVEMLKDATHLRSVEFPMQLHRGQDRFYARYDALAVEFSVRSSNDLTICTPNYFGDRPRESTSLLLFIAAIHDVEDICITCREEDEVDDVEDLWGVLGRGIRPFLEGRLKTKSLRITLIGKPETFHDSEERAGLLTVPCKSNDLTTFNVRLAPYFYRDKWQPKNLDGVQQWDAEIFPSLVLNYYGEKLTQPSDDLEFLLAIQLINEGFVYRQVTGHKPHDMNTANAGLIYALMRIKAGETDGVGGGHGDQLLQPTI